jgi:two-component system sensor histidine kinase HydH
MALGHVALDVAWPQAAPLGQRLWTDAVILAFALCVTVVFESFAQSQRRGLRLRRELERTVVALEHARRRAEDGVAEVGRLAATVAHEVNNPLSAVKVNVRWLGENGRVAEGDGERAEVVADALSAVERISRIVAGLRLQAAERADRLTAPSPPQEPPAAPRPRPR